MWQCPPVRYAHDWKGIGQRLRKLFMIGSSRVVRSSTQVGIEHLLTGGRRHGTIAGFHRDEYGIDLSQYLGIIVGQSPALLARIIIVKNAETDGGLLIVRVLTPDVKRNLSLRMRLCQIVSVEDQGTSLHIKDPSESTLALTFSI